MKQNKSKKITVQKLAQIMTDGFAQIRKESADGFALAKKDNEDLAATMADGFVRAKKDNEDLAVMVQQGFEEARCENEKRFAKLEQGQAKLEQGQEDIKLHLSNFAYKIDFIDLQKRVQKVEDIVLRKKG